ncbi:Acetyl propionyl-CoA carboxylase alpha subunit [Pyrenophora tritici-repentis]|uniref:3-methylcrotonyl-carboxylase protein n=1 Tax=Pyrenophora tritici-repentis TaxID=45151 RepID=A0A2W1G9V0_9PLEO|nr:3-methylcrotonyl-carboxylase subunit alpha [Pyrenophora tritici-repentis]KAF7453367.1 3-methylcrotonyl-carboxylase protein [Pyrenophora tritici-repentis]KAI0572357.1 3-methylcrotonyl-carboxylase subunit alpha [Pyrenophora tritici-repentis]KAI0581228.1 3-methylcrotonyl-carboxylase subunit alpha [Pyrenophora tritici-repentis]KAI0606435.1 3-methylcrotonyl-carboxylase subunit alpha [Pyrenophora tritici-repentis]
MRAFRKSSHLSRQLLAAKSARCNSTVAPATKSLTSVLIANRGEIALRVGRTASEYGIRTTTLFTDPDARSQHALSSPYAVNLGDPSAYLDGDRIIQIAKEQGCQGIHPGYGFLSENPTFARKCKDAGLTFIGPPWQAIESMGSKSESKDIMTKAGVPCIPGYHGSNQDPEYLKEQAASIGYPVLLKAVKGGGGKGMRIVNTEAEFFDQLASAKSEARNSFGDEVMLVEKYITTPRHIEVQVFADKHGNCVALGERDCSIQRRHQKILEESPAPHLDEAIRQDIWEKARQAALAVGYEGAGTVEFIFDNDTGEFFFMEMNTRLQVEHPVTEMVTGEDLVRWQLIVAEGGKLPLTQQEIEQRINERGHAIEARIYAENPDMNFIPDSGLLLHLKIPTPTRTVRIDSGFIAGDEVSSHYDPMISKLIVQGPTREAAILKLRAALEDYEVAGPITNIEFIKRMCVSPDFVAGDVETGYIQKHHAELFTPIPPTPEVYAQAALGLALQEISASKADAWSQGGGPPVTAVGYGFSTSYQARDIHLIETPASGKGESTTTKISVRQTSPEHFDITIADTTYTNVTSTFSPSSNTLTSFYPHTRLSTTLIRHEDALTLFHLGRQYRFKLAMPAWTKKALGVRDVANSVLAPMPCKVLRVEVEEGQEVKKDQPLVVIESMKMETVIRSPSHGVVKRIVHGKGDLCKAGTALVEFEDPGEEGEGK